MSLHLTASSLSHLLLSNSWGRNINKSVHKRLVTTISARILYHYLWYWHLLQFSILLLFLKYITYFWHCHFNTLCHSIAYFRALLHIDIPNFTSAIMKWTRLGYWFSDLPPSLGNHPLGAVLLKCALTWSTGLLTFQTRNVTFVVQTQMLLFVLSTHLHTSQVTQSELADPPTFTATSSCF